MPRLLPLLAGLFAVGVRAANPGELAGGTTGAWHLVSVDDVVCPGGPGWTVINISTRPVAAHIPHIFTIFRTSEEAVTVSFEVRDATGKIVVDQSKGVSLQNLMSSQTTQMPTIVPPIPTLTIAPMPTILPSIPNVTIAPIPTIVPSVPNPTIAPMPTIDPSIPSVTAAPMPTIDPSIPSVTAAPARRLSSRRRSGGGSSYSSPRRRSPTYYSPRRRSPTYTSPRRRSPTYTSPRRRSPTNVSPRRRSPTNVSPRRRSPATTTPRRRSPGSVGTQRRRTSNFNAPRRRGYYPTGVRRRTSGYGGNKYQNPYSPAAGRYGYPNQASAYQNYGGRPPMHTPYGYSGANAYKGNSGAKIAMALAGGVAAGVAASYLYNHWTNGGFFHPEQMTCTSGLWSGNCRTCTGMFPASSCMTELSPSFDASRDDLMDTGFIPADYTLPLIVNVTGIVGADYAAIRICPPVGWTPEQNGTWRPPPHASLFIATTAMQELSNADGGAGSGVAAPGSGGWSPFLTGLVFLAGICCCCVVPLAMCCAHRSKKRHHAGWSSSSDSDSEDLPPPHVVAPYPHQPMYNYSGQGGQFGAGGGGYPHQAMHNYGGQGGQFGAGGGGYNPGGRGGFLGTAAPDGSPWEDYCRRQQAFIDSSGIVGGSWGECLAWAKVYELQNPDWENDPQYREEGPCGQVVNAMLEAAPDHMRGELQEAAERMEELCTSCAERGQPLPIIGWRP